MWTPGPLEIMIILVIVLIIFGPKRLPDLGRSMGRGMREFKDSVTGKDKDELPEGAVDKPDPATTTTTTTTRGPSRSPSARPAKRMPRMRPIAHEDRLSVIDHLDELRSRLIVCAIAFIAAWALTGWQNHLVLEIVNKPLPDGIEPITLGPAEAFYTTLTNAAYAALLIGASGDPLPAVRLPAARVQPERAAGGHTVVAAGAACSSSRASCSATSSCSRRRSTSS